MQIFLIVNLLNLRFCEFSLPVKVSCSIANMNMNLNAPCVIMRFRIIFPERNEVRTKTRIKVEL